MMKTRKHHLKSRNGCTNCKKRHVKCDEQGPPCANCVSRRTVATCFFEGPARSTSSSRQSPDVSSTSASASASESDLVQKPSLLGAPAEIDTLTQLELMHRWSTTTYKGFVSIPADVSFYQVMIPQGGLQFRFLLDGIFAASALDIALSGHSDAERYRREAMKLYDRASSRFRQQLTRVSKENISWVFIYSGMVSMFNAAMLQVSKRSAIDTVMVMFELYIGCAIVGYVHREILASSIYSKSIEDTTKAFWGLPLADRLEDSTEEVFQNLQVLADARASLPETIEDPLRLYPTWDSFFQSAIPLLHRCYLEDEKKVIAGTCLAFPAMVGPEIITACRARDPMGLALLLVWALLIHRLRGLAWWARDLGSKLILEITTILLGADSPLAARPELHAIVYWANTQVGRQARKTVPWVADLVAGRTGDWERIDRALEEAGEVDALQPGELLNDGYVKPWRTLQVAMSRGEAQ